MTTNYKVLGQVNPAATTSTTLYTVPAATQTVCSTLSICNQGVSTTVNVAVQVAGAALTAKQYIVYQTTVNQYDTLNLTLGLSLAATDLISVYAGTANVSFSLFGSEMS